MTEQAVFYRPTIAGIPATYFFGIAVGACTLVWGGLYFLENHISSQMGETFVEKYQVAPDSFATVNFSDADLAQIDVDAVSGVAVWEGTGPASLMNAGPVAACIEGGDGSVSTIQLSRPDDGLGKVSTSGKDDFVQPLIDAGICDQVIGSAGQ